MSGQTGVAAGLDLSRLVAIAGAGFSKHASSSMPVLTELGEELVERLPGLDLAKRLTEPEQAAISSGKVPMGNIESWMTALASPQPFHTASERFTRRSVFEDVSGVVAELISVREREALRGALPSWLARLVTIWHYCRSTVLTFNYDTLIESAVETLNLTDSTVHVPSELGRVTARSLTRGFPPRLPRSGMRYGDIEVETFELLKLHGSLNWWGRPAANDLFSIVDGDSAPRWTADVEHTSPMRGLLPVIVPPIADKSGQYSNSTIETLWSEAAQSIRDASTLVLFGYSLPATDTTASALITENLAVGTPILVIDPNQAEIERRLRSWLPNVVTGAGSDDLGVHATVVDRVVDDLERAAVPVALRWHEGQTRGTTHRSCFVRIETADGATLDCSGVDRDVVVAGEPAPPGGFTARPSPPPVDATALAGCRFVALGDGRHVPIYRFDRVQNTNEHSVVSLRTGPR